MNLEFKGWDKDRGAYRVTRHYDPKHGEYNFAWFVQEDEAKRLVELFRHLTDIESSGNS